MRFFVVALIVLLPFVASLKVSCNYENWSSKEFIGMTYQCIVENLKVEVPKIIVEEVDGNYVGKEFTKTVVRITIRNTDCKFMPSGFENHFQNILGLEISNSKLKKITQEDIKPFPKLKDLNLSHNHLTSLDTNLLEHNSMLKSLDFSFNRIHTLSVEILDSIDDVYVNFLGNACVNLEGKSFNSVNEIRLEIMKNCQKSGSVAFNCDCSLSEQMSDIKST